MLLLASPLAYRGLLRAVAVPQATVHRSSGSTIGNRLIQKNSLHWWNDREPLRIAANGLLDAESFVRGPEWNRSSCGRFFLAGSCCRQRPRPFPDLVSNLAIGGNDGSLVPSGMSSGSAWSGDSHVHSNHRRLGFLRRISHFDRVLTRVAASKKDVSF